MPYVRVGRLRQLEVAEKELLRVQGMTPGQFVAYIEERRIQAAVTGFMHNLAADMWATSPLFQKVQSIRGHLEGKG